MIVLGRKPGGGGGPGGGVTSIAESGQAALTGAVTLSEGTGVTLTQAGQDIEIAASGGGLYDAVAIIRYQVASNTNGGTTTTNNWVTRPLNTETYDPDGIVSIASNQFTLAAGSYEIDAYAQALGNSGATSLHKMRLQNITAATTLDYSASVMLFNTQGPIPLRTAVTIAGSTVFEFQHRTNDGRANVGMGLPFNVASVDEIYLEAVIRRFA
jgi:hypothetical protein